MTTVRRTRLFFSAWAMISVLAGSVLMSYHQPFRSPDGKILSLIGSANVTQWRLVHVLSGGCGCSQQVMGNLLKRGVFPDAAEEVIVIDGSEAYLSGSDELLRQLSHRGFAIRHIAARLVPAEAGLRGVPLLVVTRPGNDVAYVGGYGVRRDSDGPVYRNLRDGGRQDSLPLMGCAVGVALRRAVDPFRLKYQGN
jgi:hypothetical protein